MFTRVSDFHGNNRRETHTMRRCPGSASLRYASPGPNASRKKKREKSPPLYLTSIRSVCGDLPTRMSSSTSNPQMVLEKNTLCPKGVWTQTISVFTTILQPHTTWLNSKLITSFSLYINMGPWMEWRVGRLLIEKIVIFEKQLLGLNLYFWLEIVFFWKIKWMEWREGLLLIEKKRDFEKQLLGWKLKFTLEVVFFWKKSIYYSQIQKTVWKTNCGKLLL